MASFSQFVIAVADIDPLALDSGSFSMICMSLQSDDGSSLKEGNGNDVTAITPLKSSAITPAIRIAPSTLRTVWRQERAHRNQAGDVANHLIIQER
ncbi:MAG: hypothetical protein U5K84_05385 [Alkalibacterium sp.]|nr:hypothetical protein [Alkalibacterium sp.]